MGDLNGYFIVGFCAMIVTLIATPIVRSFAKKRNWVAVPDERKVHTVATPDVGGIAMFAGVVVALGLAWQMDRFSPLFRGNSEPRGILLAALLILVIGVIDDVRELSAPARVLATVGAAMILVQSGVTMFYFRIPFFGVIQLSSDWVPIVTVVWLLGMVQAINLIDGLDGLAAGIVAIGSTAFFIYSFHLSDLGLLSEPNIGPLIAVITIGVCVGFLPYNFNGASIFMGDGGSYFLGFTLAAVSIVGPAKGLTTVSLLLPLLILSLPLADMSAVIMGRLSDGHSPFYPDRRHLHHRLLRAGFSHRRTVVLIYVFTQWLASLAMVVANVEMRFLWLGLATAILVATVVTINRQRHLEAALDHSDQESPTSDRHG